MNTLERKEFYEQQIEFANKMIGYSEKYLEFIKGQMKRERKESKEMLEYVWSKGVLTEMEMRIYGCETFKTVELEKLEKEARKERKRIRKYKKEIEECKTKLANLK